ncbi:RNAse P Rpr2/Rpp21/SNM1 subunit domain-domain containing protein [Rhodotorula toruloides]|uniref:RNAse P Rpr2/Rpp21/SNM1 subunit domain-domain containing protein n=1 Tax=Rhodotorula toruloides TaxID=5286 RepID=A0A2T0AE30_RHOTO|nr:RNAse P Rpr2/Rpp21/SNM1 subunit domain-domain containing protein [Rhodotorula toruloides]
MGKKGRNTAAEPTAATPVVSRDSLQRLSYLYQASVLLNSALAGAAEDAAGKRKGGKRRRLSNEGAGPVGDEKEVSKGDQLMKDKDGEDATSEVQKAGEATERPHKRIRSRSDGLQPVAQRVAREMKEVAKKATVRMDPAVKRTVCQGCATVLVPGVTSTVRVKPSGPHGHLVVHTCLSCRRQRRLPASPHLASAEPDATPDVHAKKSARERREERQARRPVFFERDGHVVVRGNAVVKQE